MDQHINKITLRRKLLSQRRSLSPEQWRSQSDRMGQILKRDPSFRSAQVVLAYFSTRQELDLSSLWLENSQIVPQKTFGFPVCEGDRLLWYAWEPRDALVTGAFGIQEPDRSSRRIEPHEVDLMLVPCVGCDRSGYRLGYGGGFYDRLLADPAWRSVPTIGIVFDFAIVERLPTEAWDIPLQRICCNQGLLSFNNQ
jgi:5-formyltetrahydrofolate cyclo-ligase